MYVVFYGKDDMATIQVLDDIVTFGEILLILLLPGLFR